MALYSYLHSPICLHGMYRDFAFTFCTLPLPVTHRFVMSLSTPYTADGTSVFHFLPGLCQCVLGNWCHCFSNFSFQFGNVCRQMQHKHGLFTLECGGSGKLPIHVVALLYESERAHLLPYRVCNPQSARVYYAACDQTC